MIVKHNSWSLDGKNTYSIAHPPEDLFLSVACSEIHWFFNHLKLSGIGFNFFLNADRLCSLHLSFDPITT